MHLLKSNWTLALISTALLQTLAIPNAFARGGHGDGFGPMMHEKALKQLSLTQEQKDKLQKIRSESKDESKSHFKEMRAAREELMKKMEGTASDDELRSQFNQLQAKRSELQKNRFERMLQVRAILTPEQRKQLGEIAKKHKKDFKDKHRGHPGTEESEEE